MLEWNVMEVAMGFVKSVMEPSYMNLSLTISFASQSRYSNPFESNCHATLEFTYCRFLRLRDIFSGFASVYTSSCNI